MEKVLYDLQLTQAIFDTQRDDFRTDEQKRPLLEGILKKHKITQQILDSSLVYYAVHTEQFIRMNDSVIARLKRQQKILDKIHRDEEILAGIRKDRRLYASFAYLSPLEPAYTFSLDSLNPRNIKIVDIDSISLNVLGVSTGVNISSSVKFEYSDTSIIIPFDVNGRSYLALAPQLPDRTLKNISGYIYASSESPYFNVLVHNIRFQCDSIKAKSIAFPKDSITVITTDS